MRDFGDGDALRPEKVTVFLAMETERRIVSGVEKADNREDDEP